MDIKHAQKLVSGALVDEGLSSPSEPNGPSSDHFRDHFVIPTRSELSSRHIGHVRSPCDNECTYLCGNSLGLQPKATVKYVNEQLNLWRTKGVYGHFQRLQDCLIPSWLDFDETLQAPMARIVGAQPSEVAIMQTLSANLHILLGSFYKPTASRYKIMIEAKSFPSDHFVVESQIRHHGRDPADGMLLLNPPFEDSSLLPIDHILAEIDTHAESIAILLLPGIQFYTGQFFDIQLITAHAQSKGITVGWDLAHAVGNVPLSLHDWNVDFAAWCNYKYVNAGPGAIGSLFVHSRHTQSAPDSNPNSTVATTNGKIENDEYRPRLQGWWGSTKSSRFTMDNKFSPISGAGGFQISNPSALDMSALLASLSVFEKTSMEKLRARSIKLTAYLEILLDSRESNDNTTTHGKYATTETNGESRTSEQPDRKAPRLKQNPYTIITPRDPAQRGAQLSVRLQPGLLDHVLKVLEEEGVVIDERKPDVVRVAPAPLYNTFKDCERFVEVFKRACADALDLKKGSNGHTEA